MLPQSLSVGAPQLTGLPQLPTPQQMVVNAERVMVMQQQSYAPQSGQVGLPNDFNALAKRPRPADAPMTAEEAVAKAAAEGLTLMSAPTTKTGFKGVSRGGKSQKKPYQAVRGPTSLGYYATPEEAALVYARHVAEEDRADALGALGGSFVGKPKRERKQNGKMLRWTPHEEEHLRTLVGQHGATGQWARIASDLGTDRTAAGVDQHWQILVGRRKRRRSGGKDDDEDGPATTAVAQPAGLPGPSAAAMPPAPAREDTAVAVAATILLPTAAADGPAGSLAGPPAQTQLDGGASVWPPPAQTQLDGGASVWPPPAQTQLDGGASVWPPPAPTISEAAARDEAVAAAVSLASGHAGPTVDGPGTTMGTTLMPPAPMDPVGAGAGPGGTEVEHDLLTNAALVAQMMEGGTGTEDRGLQMGADTMPPPAMPASHAPPAPEEERAAVIMGNVVDDADTLAERGQPAAPTAGWSTSMAVEDAGMAPAPFAMDPAPTSPSLGDAMGPASVLPPPPVLPQSFAPYPAPDAHTGLSGEQPPALPHPSSY